MVVLLGIGFLAGVVTALSPCVLPVLPVLLAGGATGRKPLRIVAGLVLSFTVFTLFAASVLRALGLPQDLLRTIAIALLFLLAATLLIPRLGEIVERPFARLTRVRPAGGGGFVLGLSLGLVFVPCAGPVLAAVTAVAATSNVGVRAVALTLAYACGAALPMLLVARGGGAFAGRLRTHAPLVRTASGIAIGLVALAIALHVDEGLQTSIPGYTDALQGKIERTSRAERELAKLRGGTARAAVHSSSDGLKDYGPAPELHPTGRWFNSRPLTMRSLRGRVVLVDFWTYSCINCLRTLPHVKAWNAAYRARGLTVIGVHTPEFAFEHEAGNVGAAIRRLGVRYPVVQDNSFRTWNAYANEYWPAKYLIDRAGHVRYIHFGEGSYGKTEAVIRQLLGAGGRGAAQEPDTTPTELVTPESYLGYERLDRYDGTPIVHDRMGEYRLPSTLPQNDLAYGGRWRVGGERIVAGRGARLQLHFHARDVYLVLGGRGHVDVYEHGRQTRRVPVDSYRLYTLRSGLPDDAVMELRFTPGVAAYAFTFG